MSEELYEARPRVAPPTVPPYVRAGERARRRSSGVSAVAPAQRLANTTSVAIAASLSIAVALAYAAAAVWPLGTHGDEPKKVQFVLSGEQDFFHPLLMLQLALLANAVAGHADPAPVIELARMLAAGFGGRRRRARRAVGVGRGGAALRTAEPRLSIALAP